MDVDLKLEADYKITEQDYVNAMRLNNRMTKKGAFIFGFLTSLFYYFQYLDPEQSSSSLSEARPVLSLS